MLTFSFFPRLNFPTDLKILLLYPTVPIIIFKFISLGKHVDIFSNAVIDLTRCVTESVLITLDIFLSVYSVIYASVNSNHQHPPPPGLTPGEFFKVVKFPAPRQKIFAELQPWGKKIDKNPTPGDNFVDLQDNFAMIMKPFTFFWYSSLAWLSLRFFRVFQSSPA